MNTFTKHYEEIYQSIIRPYREDYQLSDLGPEHFEIAEKQFVRQDFQLKNSRNLSLQCSFYYQNIPILLPCVIYLHTHTGSRLEAMPILSLLLPSNINILTFDFSGSGASEGEYVSLGWFEREDIGCIINYLRENNKATCIGLWGRGMGAVAALLYADRDPCIGGMVLDSPFVSLKQLAEEEMKKRASIPGFIKSAAIEFVRKSILKLAKFDVNDLNTLEHVINTFVPALFCCGKDDSFVSSAHSLQLFDAYPGDKKFTLTEGGHRSIRPKHFLDSVAIFFYNTLLCEQILVDFNYQEPDNNSSDDSYELL